MRNGDSEKLSNLPKVTQQIGLSLAVCGSKALAHSPGKTLSNEETNASRVSMVEPRLIPVALSESLGGTRPVGRRKQWGCEKTGFRATRLRVDTPHLTAFGLLHVVGISQPQFPPLHNGCE